MADPAVRRLLPPVFVASSGQKPFALAGGMEVGILLRDLDLMTLIGVAEAGSEAVAVDLDSVDGLSADEAGARFVMGRLGVRVVMTHRPALAALVAEAGGLSLVHVFAFDSTGLTKALEDHPARRGVGTVISPGPVLSHLTAADLERLPRPIVAYGLIDSPERAHQLLTIADSVVVGADSAEAWSKGPGFPGEGLPRER